MTHTELSTLFTSFAHLNIAVVGDVMLDTYWWGNTERISPEAPVPVVAVSKKEQRIGGAGNVALNAAALGAQVSLISITGNDDEGRQLVSLLNQSNINTKYIAASTNRITTNKIRIISRNQHMMRLDAEQDNELSAMEETQLIAAFKKYVAEAKPALVILEDYNKGVLTPAVISSVIAICKTNNIFTAVDPKRKNFFEYRAVDIFKPNLKEVKESLNILNSNCAAKDLTAIHDALHDKLQHNISFITLSEKGVFYQQQNNAVLIPTHVRSIADVSGAGDTVIAVAAVVYAASQNVQLMAEIANIAAGIVCEEVGTVAISKEKLFAECTSLLVQ